jgi:hypothetical protein
MTARAGATRALKDKFAYAEPRFALRVENRNYGICDQDVLPPYASDSPPTLAARVY